MTPPRGERRVPELVVAVLRDKVRTHQRTIGTLEAKVKGQAVEIEALRAALGTLASGAQTRCALLMPLVMASAALRQSTGASRRSARRPGRGVHFELG
jgi:hypothetical protein